MFGFFRKPKTESVADKFVRLFAFHAQMADSTRTAITALKQQDQPDLLISNYSHLLLYLGQIAVMQWRLGEDPRPAIANARQASREMIACWDEVDPQRALSMEQVSGITDWDLLYALFWLTGVQEPFQLGFPRLLEERYFAYSRFLLHRVTGTDVPAPLAKAVARFQSGSTALVDQDFHDKLALLDSDPASAETEALIQRIEGRWPQRRRNGFYQRSAPLQAGHDASNELSVDYQLACILRRLGIARPHSLHAWRWS